MIMKCFAVKKKSIRILWHGFNDFRQFTEEDLEGMQKEEKEA